MNTVNSIPITVFTGFVGAGKTTTILALLAGLPKKYKACLLKNEFGDVQVDSQLAKQSNLAGVSEILNGCMCCILVGQMKTALLEIKDNYRPDRIFIETSGSAFPAALAFQVRELEQETNGAFKLDAIVTVIDAENFAGYEDISPTARMQASYTDVILINKWEHVSERHLDVVLDHLHTLNDLTPKIKCNGKGGVDPVLIFGLDTKLFGDTSKPMQDGAHNDEIEVITLWRGAVPPHHDDSCTCNGSHHHVYGNDRTIPSLDETLLSSALSVLSKESVWRVKGFVRLASPGAGSPTDCIVNWAFGRLELTPRAMASDSEESKQEVFLTVMGERGEVRRMASRFAKIMGVQVR